MQVAVPPNAYQQWRAEHKVTASVVHMFAGLETWDKKFIRIEVCEMCEHWPLNGDQALNYCVQCKAQREVVDGVWGPTTVKRPLPVKAGAFHRYPRRKGSHEQDELEEENFPSAEEIQASIRPHLSGHGAAAGEGEQGVED